MNVLLFSDRFSEASNRLIAVIKNQVHVDHLYICRRIEDLEKNMRVSSQDRPVVIVMVHDRGTLESIIAIGEKYGDCRCVLILPDRQWKTHYLSLQLSPCCISYMDSDFADITLELARMMMRDARIEAVQLDNLNLQQQISG